MANTPERQMHGGRGLGWLDGAGLAAIVDVASGLDLAAQGTCSATAVAGIAITVNKPIQAIAM